MGLGFRAARSDASGGLDAGDDVRVAPNRPGRHTTPDGPVPPCGRERMPPPGQSSGRAGRCAQTLSGRDEQIGVGRQLGQRHADAAHGDADVGADLEQPQP